MPNKKLQDIISKRTKVIPRLSTTEIRELLIESTIAYCNNKLSLDELIKVITIIKQCKVALSANIIHLIIVISSLKSINDLLPIVLTELLEET